MALFKGREEKLDGREGLTIISEEAYFHGVLTAKGSLRVDGSVEGDITDAVSVAIGKKGRVKGNVAAETLSISGEVQGDVIASRSVEIMAEGRLKGNLRTPSLHIEEGASFDGSCSMSDFKEGKSSRRERKGAEPEPSPLVEQAV